MAGFQSKQTTHSKRKPEDCIYFVACEMAMMFQSGLLHSSVADMTRRCCLINHDQVKGEADQARERGKKGEMKKRKKREIGRGDHNEWLPTVTSSGFRLKLSVLPGRLNTFKARRKKKLSVYMCVWEKRQRQGHNPTEALCTLVMRWVLLVARICRMTGRLLGGGTDEKWTDSRMVILSWGACDGACTVAGIMRHTLQSNAKHHNKGNTASYKASFELDSFASPRAVITKNKYEPARE